MIEPILKILINPSMVIISRLLRRLKNVEIQIYVHLEQLLLVFIHLSNESKIHVIQRNVVNRR